MAVSLVISILNISPVDKQLLVQCDCLDYQRGEEMLHE